MLLYRFIRTPALFLSILITVSTLPATPLLNVHLPDDFSRAKLMNLGVDVIESDRTSALVVGWDWDRITLEENGLAYTIEIDNIEAHNRRGLNHELDDMGGYPEFHEIQE